MKTQEPPLPHLNPRRKPPGLQWIAIAFAGCLFVGLIYVMYTGHLLTAKRILILASVVILTPILLVMLNRIGMRMEKPPIIDRPERK